MKASTQSLGKTVENQQTQFVSTSLPGTIMNSLEVLAFILAKHKNQATNKKETIQVNLDGSVVTIGTGAEEETKMVEALQAIMPGDVRELQETLSLNSPIYRAGLTEPETVVSEVTIKLGNGSHGVREVLLHPENVEIPMLYGLMAST